MAKIIQIKDDITQEPIYPVAYNQGGAKMDLLWANPNPTSAFNPQTIALDLSNYNLIGIIFKIIADQPGYSSLQIYLNNNDISFSSVNSSDDSNATLLKRHAIISNNGIEIKNGYIGGNTSPFNTCIIPYKIYGIKLSYVVPTEVQGLSYEEVE